MSEAIHAYHSVTATDEFRSLEWMRQKTAHDEAQALANARRKERELWQGVVSEAVAERNILANERDVLATERNILATERNILATERDTAMAENAELRRQITLLTNQD